MPAFIVTSPDGRKFRVNAPEGATQEEVLAYAQKHMPKPVEEKYDPTEGMSGIEKFLAGAGKAMVDTGRGLGSLVGIVSQEDIDAAKKRDAALMNTGAGIGGNVVGNIATMLAPGAALGVAGKAAHLPTLVNAARAMTVPRTVAGGTALGGAMGAVQPVASDESRERNIMAGAAGGFLGNAAPKAVGAIIKPNIAPEAQALLREGVPLTPGQILGGMAKAAEEKATSVPIVGGAIAGAQRRSVEGYNRAAYNRVLGNIGEKAGDKVGHEGVAATGDAVSRAYNKLLPKLRGELDADLAGSIDDIAARLAAELPPPPVGMHAAGGAKQYETIVNRYVLGRFTGKDGAISGEAFKKIESDLSRIARGYVGSQAAEVRQLGYALNDTNAALREMLVRHNPDKADALKAINAAWADLVRVEGAAGRVGSKEGIFTPAAMTGSVKGADRSVRHRAFSRGEARMQDFAKAGEKVMGSRYPDSGTAGRGAQIATAVAAAHQPALLAGLLGGAGMYTKPGIELARMLLASRPEMAGLLAGPIRESAPYLTAPGASLLLSQ